MIEPERGCAARHLRHPTSSTSRSSRSCEDDSPEDIPVRRAELALTDLSALPLERSPTLRLIPRCWQLRGNLTVYDAAYVALAEALAAPLLTADARLAAATGPHCPIGVLR